MALVYHQGQREVQDEANTRPVADRLATFVRDHNAELPAFIEQADLILLATPDDEGTLRFQAMSGQAPLVMGDTASWMQMPAGVVAPAAASPAGGIAINLQTRRRARLNGRLVPTDEGLFFNASETFYNCRKYIAPSALVDDALHIGPVARTKAGLHDAGLAAAVSRVETAFVASLGESGTPDVSHRGGPRGFISLDAATGVLSWSELIGNGMFKTAGNIRANGRMTLLVLDIESGDAYELSGNATYKTAMRYEEPHASGLWPHHDDFPVQGGMRLRVTEAWHLQSLIRPRRRLEDVAKVTSCSTVEEQVPR